MHVGLEIAHETIFHSVYHSILQRLVRGAFWSLHMSLFIGWCPLWKLKETIFIQYGKSDQQKNGRQASLISEVLLHRKVQSTKCCYCLNSLYKLAFSWIVTCLTCTWYTLQLTSVFFSGTVICISPKILIRKNAFLPWCVLFFAEYRSQKTEIIDLSLLHCIMTSVCDGLLCFCGFLNLHIWLKPLLKISIIFANVTIRIFPLLGFGTDIFTKQFFLGFQFSANWTLDPYKYILDRCKPKSAFGLLFG